MRSNNQPSISVIVPVFNEEACLLELFNRLQMTFLKLEKSYELIFVDDGSSDQSWEILNQIMNDNPVVKGIKFSRNFGHHVAITAGLDHAAGHWVVVMDSDLQDQPEEIPKLYAKALQGYDIVMAKRTEKKHSPLKSKLSELFYRALSHMSDIQFDSQVGVFRIMSAKAVKEISKLRENTRFFVGLSQWIGFKTAYVDVVHDDRFAGETKYPISKQIALATQATLSFSDKPLKISLKLGMFCSLIGVMYACLIIYQALMGQIEVMGYASLMSAILIVGGLTITSIGLTGLYVGRIFNEVKGRPLYISEKKTNFENPRVEWTNAKNTGALSI